MPERDNGGWLLDDSEVSVPRYTEADTKSVTPQPDVQPDPQVSADTKKG